MRWEAARRAHGRGVEGLSVGALCVAAGMTRQNFYRQRELRRALEVEESLVLDLVRRERARMPMLGGKKLLHLILDDLRAGGIDLGRDRLFEVLKRHGLLIPRKSRCGARTTDSRHRFLAYPNLARTLKPTGPHQLLLSDITYIRTLEGFMYLCLVSDAFSRAIVGYDASDSLEMEGALRALSMALGQLPAGARPMHHSDRGVQYCCTAYVSRLRKAGLAISMTEEDHCYENAQAERLNGTMKREFGLGGTLARKRDVRPAVREAVMLYNECRPHEALGYRVPGAVHRGGARVRGPGCRSARPPGSLRGSLAPGRGMGDGRRG